MSTEDEGHETIVQQLRRLSDEVRVKLNLAGKEARDTWEGIEPRLHEFERRAQEAGGKIAGELSKAGHQLKEQMNSLIERIRN